MSIGDSFYKGLTNPLQVVGAQLPQDMVPYAGGPADALKQHIQKYKQLARLQRHSDQVSKQRLKELAEEEEDMDKVSFIGNNPASRRAYYLSKLAEDPVLPGQEPSEEALPLLEAGPPNIRDDRFPERDLIDLYEGASFPRSGPGRQEYRDELLDRGRRDAINAFDQYKAMSNMPEEVVSRFTSSEPTALPEPVAPPPPPPRATPGTSSPVAAPVASPPPRSTPGTSSPVAAPVAPPSASARPSASPGGAPPLVRTLPEPKAPTKPRPQLTGVTPIRTPKPYDLGSFGEASKAPPAPKPPPPPPPRPGYGQQYNEGQARFVGDGRQDLGDSGDVARRLSELGGAMSQYRGKKYKPADRRGIFDRISDTLEHYGTRAARGLSTGAQMGASKLYDIANRGGYLDEDSFIGRNVRQDLREQLNREMADINASLYHAYGGEANLGESGVYRDRFKNMDLDLDQGGTQEPSDLLLDPTQFRRNELAKQYNLLDSSRLSPTEQKERLEEIANTIDNYYGFQGNRLGTGRISEDIDGTAFSRAMREIGSGALTNPASLVARGEALSTLLKEQPELLRALEDRFGEEASKAGVPLVDYVAGKISTGLDPRRALIDAGDENNLDDDIYETVDDRLNRYETTRRVTQDILTNMPAQAQAQFINAINPRVVQRAEEINALMESDPQEALAQINAMDPEEARFLLDQVSMFSQFISPETAQREFNYDDYRISEDDENLFGGLFNFGGSDIVNRARQQVGAGGNIDDLTGAARDRVFGYNSMRDTPRGRFYLAERGALGDTFFNPTTGEVNYELGGDLGGLGTIPGTPSLRGGRATGFFGSPEFARRGTTYESLPAEYRQQYRDAVGAENSGLRSDYYLVDDGVMGNYYYNPYSGDRNYEFLYGNTNQFQNKPLPQQFHEQYRRQFNKSPSYRG